MKPRTISVNEAIEQSGLKRNSIYKLINSGRLKSTMVLKRRLIDYQSFCRLLAHAPVHASGRDDSKLGQTAETREIEQ
jgi:hypothetical protein